MTAWYYSDHQRNRLGPVAATDLAELHASGQLQPGTLVWREGLAGWKPWHEVMDEVLGAGATPMSMSMPPASVVPVQRPAFGVPNDMPAQAVASGYNPYQVVDRVAASPYAPPSASIAAPVRAVSGGHVVYARFLKRFAGNAVDGLIGGLAAYAVLIPVMLLMGAGLATVIRGGAAAAGLGIGFIALVYAIQFCVPAVYYGAMQASASQATLGKQIADIKLARPDGSPVSFWRGFLRSITFVLTVLLTCGLGALATALMTVLTDRRQGLHDLICDTVVVDQYAFTDRPELQDETLNTWTKVVLALYVLFIAAVFVIAMMVGILGARAH